MDLKGSKTEQNLYRTFAGESRARTKYTLYGEKARVDGYQWVAQIFDETAYNELAHAREVLGRYLKLIGCTKDNLLDSVQGETNEAQNVYKQYEVEDAHSKRFKELYDKIEDGTMFKGTKDSLWVCMNCGYIHEGEEPPLICPLCKYPRAYFKPYCKVSNA